MYVSLALNGLNNLYVWYIFQTSTQIHYDVIGLYNTKLPGYHDNATHATPHKQLFKVPYTGEGNTAHQGTSINCDRNYYKL